MKKIATTILLSATLLSSSSFAADPKNNILATFNDTKVTEMDISKKFAPLLEQSDKKFNELEKGIQRALVESYIGMILSEREAKRLGIKNSPEFKEKLETIEQNLLAQELIMRFLKTAITDNMINAAYDDYVKNNKGKKEIKVSHILVSEEKEAKDIKAKLNKGEKFEDLAKLSKDVSSAKSGGSIGYITKGNTVPAFESKAFSLKKGEVSEPVKTDFGWHIIRTEDIRDLKILPKKEVLDELKSNLERKAIEDYKKQLHEKANVKINL